MALTKINNNSLSAITGLPAGVGGKVLQVVTAVPTSNQSTTSTSYADTNYTVTISPTATNSTIIVTASGNWGMEGDARGLLQFLSNSSGSFTTLKVAGYASWEKVYGAGMSSMTVIEENVGTTDAVTYKMQCKSGTSGITFYVPINNTDASSIIAYEIAG